MVIVTVGGLPGAGKTTVARKVSEELGLKHVNMGEIFRGLAESRAMTLEEFGAFARRNPEVDRSVDGKALEVAKGGKVLLEGRLTGPMLKRNGVEAFQVWLDAPLKVRAQRIASRDGLSFASAVAATQAREKVEWDRYFEIYGIDLRETDGYDLVIDTSDKAPDEVAAQVIAAVKKKGKK
jgi:cytidylate kinase